MPINLKHDALFIADAHYNNNKQELFVLLNNILNKKIITSQLILMGDMFDFLSEEITYFKRKNQEVINLINLLTNQIEIIYLEGNHDFNLKNIFPNIEIFPRNKQALIFKHNNKQIALAHGDIFTPISYNIYTFIIRNTFVLKLFNFLDIKNIISSNLDKWLMNKNISHEFTDFENFAKKRIQAYKHLNVDIVIEGHFHQGKRYENYINLSSLAVNNKYMQIINCEFVFV